MGPTTRSALSFAPGQVAHLVADLCIEANRSSLPAVSELNEMGNPVLDFVFENPDGTTTLVSSPDPGRALITGKRTLDHLNAFKIPTLWGVSRTAPYFHDNSAATLEDLMRHYKKFFALVTDPARDGDPAVELTDEDLKDIIAFMKLLD